MFFKTSNYLCVFIRYWELVAESANCLYTYVCSMAVADDEWPQILQLLTEKVKKNDLIRQTVAPPAFEEKVSLLTAPR